MKHYKNEKNKLWAFDDDCLDEEGKCINEYALKVIEENSLIEITKEEEEIIRNYKSIEQLAEEEAKATEKAELEQAEKDAEFLEMLEKWGGV